MNQNNYKTAFDSVKFSETFEQDTIEIMLSAAETKIQKEKHQMNINKIIKTTALAVVLVAVLTTSAFALSMLLSPKDVATQAGDMALAEAFESKDSIIIDQAIQTADYTVNLLGIVSGKGLTDYWEEAQKDKSYIVASVAYTNGYQITEPSETNIMFSPLISGYKPWQVNAWTLQGGYYSFVNEGIKYFLFECSNIEIFADHTVYIAVYEGGAPDSDTFTMNENGEISFTESFNAPHAMFTLPLDPAKADPNAVSQLINAMGIVIE